MSDIEITSFKTKLVDFVSTQIKQYKGLSKQKYLSSKKFGDQIIKISEQTTKDGIKSELLSLMKSLTKNTNLAFNYYRPAIWTNWGLERFRFTGSGGPGSNMSGFSSHPSSSMIDTGDVFDMTQLIFSMMIDYIRYNGKQYCSRIWRELITPKNKYAPENQDTIEIFGELYIENMPIDKLKELQIKFKSNRPFDDRSEDEKISMPLYSMITSDLLPLAMHRIAQHNKDSQDKILLEPFGAVKLSAPKTVLASIIKENQKSGEKIQEDTINLLKKHLRDQTSELLTTTVQLKSLVERLDRSIKNGQFKNTLEDRTEFMRQTFLNSYITEYKIGASIQNGL